jgi:hypothetical protein
MRTKEYSVYTNLRIRKYEFTCTRPLTLQIGNFPLHEDLLTAAKRRQPTPCFTTNNCTVGIALGYWLTGVRSPAGVRDFSLLHRVQTSSGTHPDFYPMGTDSYLSRDKAAVTWSSPPSSMFNFSFCLTSFIICVLDVVAVVVNTYLLCIRCGEVSLIVIFCVFCFVWMCRYFVYVLLVWCVLLLYYYHRAKTQLQLNK